jgi:hypothetical protein
MSRSRILPLILALGLLGFLGGSPGGAQEHEDSEHEDATHGTEHASSAEHGEHEGGVELEKNAAGLLLGGTWESAEDETYFTIGAEYARELSHRWSMSAVAEYLDDVNAWVFVFPANYLLGPKHPHPERHFNFSFGPGWEHKSRRPHGGHGDEHGHGAGRSEEIDLGEEENLFLWRTGIKYTFHRGRYEIVPALDLDLVRENGEWVEAIVFDVGIGFGF